MSPPVRSKLPGSARALLLGALFVVARGARALSPCPTPDTSNFLLAPGRTIAFMGDSITFMGNYTRQVQAYCDASFPGYNLHWINTGVGGWTAQNAYQYSGPAPQGLAYVLALHPDLVVLCFGMNDGGYISGTTTAGAANFTHFTNYMSLMLGQLSSAGIKAVLLSPGMVDLSQPGASAIDPAYNTVLQNYANWVTSYAASHGLASYDVHALAMNVDAAAKAALPGFHMLQPDGVHPDMAGALVYAYGLLKALGVPGRCQQVSLDGAAMSLTASPGLGLGPLLAPAGGWSFTLRCDPLPFLVNPAARKVLPFLPFEQDFNRLELGATGLSAPSYTISVDGYRGPLALSAASLAGGASLPAQWTRFPQSTAELHSIELSDASLSPAGACYNGSDPSVVDDMEASNARPAWPVSRWGGHWSASSGSGLSSTASPLPFLMSAPGHASGYAARLSGNFDASGGPPSLSLDLITRGADYHDGLRFWFKAPPGAPAVFRVHTLYQAAQGQWNDYGAPLTGSGGWDLVELPYSSLAFPGWGPAYALDPADIISVSWQPATGGAYDLSVDQLEFYCLSSLPAPTPLPSATPCPACSPTLTPTPSPSPAPTQGPCASVFYNGESGFGGVNLSAGAFWASPSASAVSETAAAAFSGAAGMEVVLDWSNHDWWSGMNWNWAQYNPANAWDLSSYQSLEFRIKSLNGTNPHLKVLLSDTAGLSRTAALVDYLPSGATASWQLAQIPLSAFAGIHLNAVWSFSLQTGGSMDGHQELALDDLRFVAACPSPTASPSAAPSTAMPAAVQGLGKVFGMPNPSPSALWLESKGPGTATIKIFTSGFQKALQWDSGPLTAGWNAIPLPQAFRQGLSSGLYYVSVELPATGARADGVIYLAR